MAAAAFKVALTIRNSAGQIKSVPMTVSDVAAAFFLYPSGGSELPLSSLPCVITDILYTAAGTDTTQADVYVNGVDTGIRVFNAANTGTVINRQIMNSPIAIPAGAQVKFIQRA